MREEGLNIWQEGLNTLPYWCCTGVAFFVRGERDRENIIMDFKQMVLVRLRR